MKLYTFDEQLEIDSRPKEKPERKKPVSELVDLPRKWLVVGKTGPFSVVSETKPSGVCALMGTHESEKHAASRLGWA